jgi:hypothetical protein
LFFFGSENKKGPEEGPMHTACHVDGS